ncbi:unnamed protein product, partial [marine sediment metagenome]
MEKFNKFLTVLKKYQFWVICGSVLVTTLVCWWMATRGLAGQFEKRKTKLEGDFRGVVVQPNHPNEGVIKAIHERRDLLKRGVYEAWEILYREQKEKNPLPEVLGPAFKRQFESLKPGEELSHINREIYLNFIEEHLPTLLEKVDVRRPAEETDEKRAGTGARHGMVSPERGGGMRVIGTAGEQEWIGTVDWNENDYQA